MCVVNVSVCRPADRTACVCVWDINNVTSRGECLPAWQEMLALAGRAWARAPSETGWLHDTDLSFPWTAALHSGTPSPFPYADANKFRHTWGAYDSPFENKLPALESRRRPPGLYLIGQIKRQAVALLLRQFNFTSAQYGLSQRRLFCVRRCPEMSFQLSQHGLTQQRSSKT